MERNIAQKADTAAASLAAELGGKAKIEIGSTLHVKYSFFLRGNK